MFRKVRLRLTIICAAITSLVLVIMAILSMNFSVNQLRLQFDQSFSSNLNSILYYLRGQSIISHTWIAQTEANGGLLIGIYVGDEPLMYTAQKQERLELSALARQASIQYGFDPSAQPSSTLNNDMVMFSLDANGENHRVAVASVPVNDTFLSVAVLKNTADENRQIAMLRSTFLSLTALALIALVVFSWLFSTWAVRPAEEGYKKQSEFVSAASHELRAPLAVLQASTGAMKNADTGDIEGFTRRIENEVSRLSRLTDDLLAIAGADNGRLSLQLEAAEPETIALSAFERFEGLAKDKGIELSIQLPDAPLPPIRVDAGRIAQLLAILLSNALSYVPAGGHVQIRAYREKRTVCFLISDDGPGISDEQKAHIFERFYRGDNARSDKAHFGLGLSIAKEIADLHRAALWVSNAESGGAAFSLHIAIAGLKQG